MPIQNLDLAQVLASAQAIALDLTQALESELDPDVAQRRADTLTLVINRFHHTSYVVKFLQSLAHRNRERPWYLLMASQKINAASFMNPDSQLLNRFQQLWKERSSSTYLMPAQTTFFINLATLLRVFGMQIHNTFFLEVLRDSAAPKSDFLIRLSYLFYQLVAGHASQDEQLEFWKILAGGSPLEREWLELSGLTLIRD